MKTVYFPKKEFTELENICSVESIINNRLKGTFLHAGKEFAVTGSVGNGMGTGNKVVCAQQIVDLKKYSGKKKPAYYDQHTDHRGYYSMKVKYNSRIVVFTNYEIEIKLKRREELLPDGSKRDLRKEIRVSSTFVRTLEEIQKAIKKEFAIKVSESDILHHAVGILASQYGIIDPEKKALLKMDLDPGF